MACVSGAKIKNDGLIFHFDMSNHTKSNKGINLISPEGHIFYTYSSYGTLIRNRVVEPQSPSGYALSMRLNDTDINSASRVRIGTDTHIPISGNGNVSVTVKKDGPATNIIPRVYTGASWYTLSPLDGGSIYLTDEYRRFGTNVAFGTGSGGPNPAFSMTNGWGISSWDTTTTTYWHSPQATNLLGNTRYVNQTITQSQSLVDIKDDNTIIHNNIQQGRDDHIVFDGTNDWLSCTSLTQSPSQQTISIWCYNKSGSSGVYSAYNGDTNRVRLYDHGSYFGIFSGHSTNGPLSVATPAVTQSNTWRNVTVTLDYINHDHRIYVNGVLQVTSSTVLNPPNAFGDVTIGALKDFDIASPHTYYFYNGRVSSVKIYDKVLTSGEVLDDFEATRGRYDI